MVTITTHLSPKLLAQFVLQSELEYPNDNQQDGRLSCWLCGEGTWAVALLDTRPAGIACLVTLDDGPWCGRMCLYWLEVLPACRNHGVGQALLRWCEAQSGDSSLLIKSVSAAASFYRRYLTQPFIEPEPHILVVAKGADAVRSARRRAA